MAGSLGSLVISLGLDAAQFTSGLTKAEYQAKKSLEAIAGSAKTLQNTIRGLGVGITAAGFEQLVAGSIKAQAELGRLADRAGTTVEELSSMRAAAHEGGVGLDEVALASNRLAKAIFEGQDGASKAAQALALLGLKASDLAKLPTAQSLKIVAAALNEFKESTGKTAVQMEILGRSGPAVGAFLKALAENGTIAASVTTEMAKAAREAEAKIFELTDTLNQLRTHGVNELIPAIDAIVIAFANVAKEPSATGGFWRDLGEAMRIAALGVFAIYIAARSSVTALHALGQALNVDVTSGHAAQDIKKIFDESDKSIEANIVSLNRFYDTISKGSPAFAALAGMDRPLPASIMDRSAQYKGDPYYGQGGGKRDIGNLAGRGGGGAIDDPTRKLLEAALAALKANTEQEKAVLENRDRFLQAIFDRGESSISDYYSQKQASQDEDLRRTTANYLQEIALLDNFIAHAATQREKAQGEKEKVDATSRQQLAVIQAGGRAQQTIDEQNRALIEYRHTLDDVNARMLELYGNTGKAAGIRFDNQNEALRGRLNATIASPLSTAAQVEAARQALAQNESLRKAAVAQGNLNDATIQYSLIVGKVGIEQGKIDLLFQTGAITEIDAINKRADLARQYVVILTAQADEQERIARTFAEGTPERSAALLGVQKMRLEIEQLAAASDVLAKKFNDIFAGAISDGIVALVDRTKTLKQAVTDIGKSIETQIAKIAADKVVGDVFAKGGALGGVGDFFAGIFGGGSKAKTGTGANDALTAIGITGFKTDASLLGVASAADVASAALLKLSFSSGSGGLVDAIQSAVATGFGKGNETLGDVLGLLGDVPFVGGGKDAAASNSALAASQSASTAALGAFTAGLGLAVEGTAASVVGLTALTAGLETASAAALQFATSASASGAGGGIGDLFGGSGGGFGTGSAFGNMDFGAFLAGGGIPPLGKISVVGENGPELFIPRTAGTVIPSSVIAQKRADRQTVNLHYYAAPGVSKQTAHQHAVDMARTIDTARKLNR